MKAREGDQRTRMLRAVLELVGQRGYLHTKIGEIASRAGVSRASFYEAFENKQDCFLSAHQELAAGALERLRDALQDSESPDRAAVAALVGMADDEPQRFTFLLHESLLVGSAGIAARARLLEGIAHLLTEAQGGREQAEAQADIPPRVLLGAVAHTLEVAMRHDTPDFEELLHDLQVWLGHYGRPAGERQWRRLLPEERLVQAARERGAPNSYAPARAPRGRHGLPRALVERMQRERLLYATAVTIADKGYENSSVADIVTAARVSRNVFYSHFHGRQDALGEAVEMFFRQAIAAMAGAFFTAAQSWPERVWSAGVALSDFLVSAPGFTRVACVDAYAPDAAAALRTDELLRGLSLSVEADGSIKATGAGTTQTATTGALIECALQLIEEDRLEQLTGLVPFGGYLVLTPLLGVHTAAERIHAKQAASERDSSEETLRIGTE